MTRPICATNRPRSAITAHSRRSLYLLAFWTSLAVAALACDATSKGPVSDGRPQISVDPSEIDFMLPTLSVGDRGSVAVEISNIGTRALKISGVEIEYTVANPAQEEVPAIRLSDDDISYPVIVGTPGSGDDAPLVVTVWITRYDDELERSAILHISSDDPVSPVVSVPIATILPRPLLRVVPEVIDIGQVGHDETAERAAELRNSGSADLEVTGFLFKSDNENFKLTFEAQVYSPDPDQVAVAFPAPVVVLPDRALILKTSYVAMDASPASAQLVIYSNDPRKPEGTVVEILANQEGACIKVVPDVVDFGGKVPPNQYLLPVQVENCSATKALEIYRVEFEGGTDRCAGSYCAMIPPELGSGDFDLTSPLVIPAKGAMSLNVIYAPSQAAVLGEDGQPVRDEATLLIESNAFVSTKQVAVTGFGIPDTCPVAVIHIEEGEEVDTQTVLHLHGENSFSNTGTITKYEWSVEQPALSASKFVPSVSYPSPFFEANVAGKYIFRLDVWDEFGRKSCFSSEVVVAVIPCEAIHVELLWTSPGDPDPMDEGPLVGTDLDLHFAHPNASQYDLDGDGIKDPWFDPLWDTFWYYPVQEWGSIMLLEDNPSLDRDDVDGNGPENTNLDVPEDGRSYRVGVNYWDDHGFGASYATVRVYIRSQLAFEVKDVAMIDHDMWWVCSIDWPSGEVTAQMTDAGGLWMTHDYHHPQFYQH